MQKLLAISICITFLTGCSLTNKKEFAFFGEGRVNIAGANQMLDPNIETFDDRHLITLLHPDYEKLRTGGPLTIEDVEVAFQWANKSSKLHRNQIQDRFLLGSQQTCNFYKDYLRRVDAYKGFTLGTLTTALGGAAAIVTGAAAARALGGAAGITSGINAEFDQAFFKNIAIHVITPGIDSRRDRALQQIRSEQTKELAEYNVQAAVRDALMYHNQCSLNAGLEEAAESIKEVRAPGLRTAAAVVGQIQQLQGSVQTLGAGAVLAEAISDSEMPTTALVEANMLVATENARITTRLTTLLARPELKDKLGPIETVVKKQLGETVAKLNAEQGKVTAIDKELSEKNATLALTSDQRNRALTTDEVVAMRMTAKALSRRIRSIAQEFKAFAQSQSAAIDAIEAAAKAQPSQAVPAKS